MAAGTSVKIFLADGTPDGFKIVEKSNWIGKAIICSRAQFPLVKKHEAFSRTGVYLLIGTEEDNQIPTAYIGEGDPVLNRIESHEKNKDFWETVIVFTSKDQNLNKAHIQYIEARLVQVAKEAKRCTLENGNFPTLPALSDADVADMETFIEEMKLVYSVLGVKIFDIPMVSNEPVILESLLRIKAGNEFLASGQDKPEGFVVTKGSKCLRKEVPSFTKGSKALRISLLDLGVIKVLDDNYYIFMQDYVFNSPSQAAVVILGRSANGRSEWKDNSGRTLSEIQESNLKDY